MTQDDLFRLILVIIFFTFVPFAAFHRIGSQPDEKLDRWQEGVWILFGLRLSALPWFLGSMAWMINPSWMAWSSVPIPVWLRWCGIGLIALWGFLLVWTFRHLGKNLTDTVVTVGRAIRRRVPRIHGKDRAFFPQREKITTVFCKPRPSRTSKI
jgi:protein-S-isoprenylcysteine O-methyltransferase Ste14